MAKHRVFDFNREHKNHVRVRYSNGKPYKWDVMWMTMTFYINPDAGLATIPALVGGPPPQVGSITGWAV